MCKILHVYVPVVGFGLFLWWLFFFFFLSPPSFFLLFKGTKRLKNKPTCYGFNTIVVILGYISIEDNGNHLNNNSKVGPILPYSLSAQIHFVKLDMSSVTG